MPPVFPEFSYPAKVVADGATAYWRLGESSGTTAVDVIGGANGTINGGVTLGQAGALVESDAAMTFDGATGYIHVADAPSLDFTTAVTIEAWVKPTTAGLSGYRNVVVKGQGGVAFGYGMLLRIGALGYRWSGGDYYTNSQVVAADIWSHLVVTADEAAIPVVNVYLNGVRWTGGFDIEGSAPGGSAVGLNDLPLRIGHVLDGVASPYFAGAIDEVAIYPTVLSASQIAAHYAARLFNGSYRYLHQVKYTYRDATVSYEPVCVQSATEADARNQVLEATKRYANAIGAGRTLTLQLKTSDA